jgi:hypothetical protein
LRGFASTAQRAAEAGQLAAVRSAEQLNNVVRLKEPKNGRARTVALPATATEELRSYRIERAKALLKAGIRLPDQDFVASHGDGSMMQPTI